MLRIAYPAQVDAGSRCKARKRCGRRRLHRNDGALRQIETKAEGADVEQIPFDQRENQQQRKIQRGNGPNVLRGYAREHSGYTSPVILAQGRTESFAPQRS